MQSPTSPSTAINRSFIGTCSPVRIKRKRFPTQICMAQLKTPTSTNLNDSIFEKYYKVLSDQNEKDTLTQTDNLRLHRQKSWLRLHTEDTTLLSLRSMTDVQRKSFRALFDILDPTQSKIVSVKKLALLLKSFGADITMQKLLRVTRKNLKNTTNPQLTFIQFCALLLRNDIKVKLKDDSMRRINSLRYQRKQYIKNMQYIKDTPTEGQKRVIALRQKLNELNQSSSTQLRCKQSLLPKRYTNETHEYVIPISVFIQSWHRKQLINELEQNSYLSASTIRRTKQYVSKSGSSSTSSKRQLRISADDREDEGMLSQRMLLKSLDSAISREYLKSGKQMFSFDNIPYEHKKRELRKSYSMSVLRSKDFEIPSSSVTFGQALSNAMKSMNESVGDSSQCAMYSHSKNKEAMKYEITSSYNAVNPDALKECMSSPSFEGTRKTFKKTPAQRFLLRRNSTLPKLLLSYN